MKIPFASTTANRPTHRRQRIPLRTGKARKPTDIERPLAVVLKPGKRRMFTEHLMRMLPAECLGKAEFAGHLSDYPPVGTRLARRR